MKIVTKVSVKEIKKLTQKMDGNIVIIDMPMHFEDEQVLLEQGSKPTDLRGINLLPEKHGSEQFIEYESMINIKPKQNNTSMKVQSSEVKEQIRLIIDEVVHE